MQSTPAFAFATQTGTNPALFDDSIAILGGSWGNNQSAQATVQMVTPLTVRPGPCYQESEIFLRASISPHSVTGYEVNVGNWNTCEFVYSRGSLEWSVRQLHYDIERHWVSIRSQNRRHFLCPDDRGM